MRSQSRFRISSLRLSLLFFACAALGLSACESDTAPSVTTSADAAVPKDSSSDGVASDGAASDGAASDGAATDVAAADVADNDGAATDAAEPDAAAPDAADVDTAADTAVADAAADTTDAAPAIKHRLLMVDNTANKLILLDEKEPAKGWSVAIPAGSRDLQLVAGDKVLVSHGTGAAEYALADGAKGWTVAAFTGVSTAQRLANGNTMIGSSTAKTVTDPATIIFHEVNTAGVEVAKVTVTGIESLRLARRLDNGNTVFTGENPALTYNLYEANPAGTVVLTQLLPGKGYVAQRLANGHTLATTGATVTLVELDATGTKVKELGGATAHPTAQLQWFSGFHVLANGNTVIANWLGDGKIGMGPHAVEFDANNKLVWSWKDFAAAMTVTNLLVLE